MDPRIRKDDIGAIKFFTNLSTFARMTEYTNRKKDELRK